MPPPNKVYRRVQLEQAVILTKVVVVSRASHASQHRSIKVLAPCVCVPLSHRAYM